MKIGICPSEISLDDYKKELKRNIKWEDDWNKKHL